MATDLSSLSRTLKTLIENSLAINMPKPTVTFVPPDTANAGNNVISAFLYHIIESPEFKNLPPASGSGPVPIQQAPMGLICQYMISVIHDRSKGEVDSDPQTEQ